MQHSLETRPRRIADITAFDEDLELAGALHCHPEDDFHAVLDEEIVDESDLLPYHHEIADIILRRLFNDVGIENPTDADEGNILDAEELFCIREDDYVRLYEAEAQRRLADTFCSFEYVRRLVSQKIMVLLKESL